MNCFKPTIAASVAGDFNNMGSILREAPIYARMSNIAGKICIN